MQNCKNVLIIGLFLLIIAFVTEAKNQPSSQALRNRQAKAAKKTKRSNQRTIPAQVTTTTATAAQIIPPRWPPINPTTRSPIKPPTRSPIEPPTVQTIPAATTAAASSSSTRTAVKVDLQCNCAQYLNGEIDKVNPNELTDGCSTFFEDIVSNNVAMSNIHRPTFSACYCHFKNELECTVDVCDDHFVVKEFEMSGPEIQICGFKQKCKPYCDWWWSDWV